MVPYLYGIYFSLCFLTKFCFLWLQKCGRTNEAYSEGVDPFKKRAKEAGELSVTFARIVMDVGTATHGQLDHLDLS